MKTPEYYDQVVRPVVYRQRKILIGSCTKSLFLFPAIWRNPSRLAMAIYWCGFTQIRNNVSENVQYRRCVNTCGTECGTAWWNAAGNERNWAAPCTWKITSGLPRCGRVKDCEQLQSYGNRPVDWVSTHLRARRSASWRKAIKV